VVWNKTLDSGAELRRLETGMGIYRAALEWATALALNM
jgi:hypothetical protein